MSENRRAPDDADDDLTRRAWLLRLGELTAIAGVAGLVPDLAGATTLPVRGAAAGLPPGLYEASAEHLTHVLAARDAPLVPRGAETDYAVPRRGPFQSSFFSHHELDVVTRLVRILLGNVDARAVGRDCVDRLAPAGDASIRQPPGPSSIASRLAVAYTDKPGGGIGNRGFAALVRTGLELLEQQSRERFGREFLELAGTAQTDLVREISRTPPESPLGRCYLFLRREAIRGYFTSQAGLIELDYKGNAFYGACPGCESRRG